MNEKYLHFLWKNKRLTTIDLSTTQGEELTIKNFGVYNMYSGPDFFSGSINLNGIMHVGNIEMHVNSSDWIKHGHQFDSAYNNVILHVVYNHDMEIEVNGTQLPTLEMKNLIDWEHYHRMVSKLVMSNSIPCKSQLAEIPARLVLNQLKINTHNRLSRKAEEIEELDQVSDSGMMELLFKVLLRAFGGKLNGFPFTELGFRIPVYHYLRSSAANREAILFGLSGLLDSENNDDYFQQLKSDWRFQKHRLELSSIAVESIKFKGSRPSGFPTVRLAQFAAFSSAFDWSNSFWLQEPSEILDLFRKALIRKPNNYWENHYHFEKKKMLGNSGVLSVASANVIIINAIAPFLFWYGKKSGNIQLMNKAIELLELIPLEKNTIIEKWTKLVSIDNNARFGQAILELEKHWCAEKKCLDCTIGKSLLTG